MRRRWLLPTLGLILALPILSACAAGDGGNAGPIDATLSPSDVTPTQDTTAYPSAETPTPEEPFTGDGPWEVTFVTADGVTLAGTLYGQGETGLVLAPMYPGGSEGWQLFAEKAAAQGYRVLTFDFRGQGDSGGARSSADAPADLTAAIAFMRDSVETTRIILFGSGLGGMAAIKVAPQADEIAGLVVISASRSFDGLEVTDADLTALTIPSLWLGARNDMTQNVEDMYTLAGSTDKEMWIYEGSSLQGTFIFEGADGPDLERRLFEFAARLTGS